MVFSWPCSSLSPQGAGSSHLFSHGIIHDWAWNSASKWSPWFLSWVLCVKHFGAFNLVQVSDTDFPYGLLIFLPKTISSQREGLSIIYSFFSSEEGGREQIGENKIPSSNHDHSQGTTKRPLRLSSVEQKTPEQSKKSLGSQDSCVWNQGQKPRRKSFVLFSDLQSYTQPFKNIPESRSEVLVLHSFLPICEMSQSSMKMWKSLSLLWAFLFHQMVVLPLCICLIHVPMPTTPVCGGQKWVTLT